MPSKKPITVAVVGLGRSGWNIHVARMRGDKRFRITAVADWLPERQKEAQAEFGSATFGDHKSLLRAADAELVVVATYSNTHDTITIDALKSGRHVLVEKPMARNATWARKMVKTAEETQRKLFVHHNYRFYPDVRQMLDVIASKRIGEVFQIAIRELGFSRRNDWQTLRKYAGGLMNNWGSHMVDAAVQMLGAPVAEVFCDLKLISDVGDTEDHVKLLLRAENGHVADIEISTACNAKAPKWTLLGTHGTLVSDGTTTTIRSFDPRKLRKLKVIETPPAARQYGNEDVIPWETEELPARGKSIADLYDNIWAVLREGRKMIVTPEQALYNMQIIDRAKRKSRFYT
jgi:scyllo-inositol 2-dehydrogenase (NADP+)